jgi:hypothetical protein
LAIESIAGVAIMILFLAFVMRERERKKSPAETAPAESGCNVSLSEMGWCAAMEDASGAAVLGLDDSMRLVSLGPRAARLMHAAPDGDARSHLFDIAPKSASRSMLEGAALARRGVSSSRRIEWGKLEFGASFAPLENGGVVILIRDMEEG